jgi:hypothetical protein
VAENLHSVAYSYPADPDGDRTGPIDFNDRDVDAYHFRPYPGPIGPRSSNPPRGH